MIMEGRDDQRRKTKVLRQRKGKKKEKKINIIWTNYHLYESK